MDYVYICRSGENEELRYSIRSIIKYCNVTNVWVVGNKPDWYIGNFISVKDIGNKFQNINNCYKEIINNKNISENFILMNDDFFILSKNTNSWNYYSGKLKDKITNHISISGNSSYARALKGALKELKKRGIEEPINYDIHTPMAFTRANLAQVIDLSLAPRSMYGNIFVKDSINIEDVKIYKNSIDLFYNDFISTEDNSFKIIEKQLQTLFPNATKYEIN